MLLLSVWGVPLLFYLASSATVDVYTGDVLHRVDEKYLSLTLDQFLLGLKPKWITFDFSSPRVQTLLRGLSPGYLRFGGSPADYSMFTEADPAFLAELNKEPIYQSYSKQDLDDLVTVTRASGLHLLFELNMQLRAGDQYDPTNVIEILEYFQEKGYGDNVDFELGNEPNEYGSRGLIGLNGTRLGWDYVMLRKVLDHYSFVKDCVLVGPDIVGDDSHSLNMFKDFIDAAGHVVNAATFHHYYFYGPSAKLAEYINPKNFQNLADIINLFRNSALASKYPTLPIWIGETSDSWGAGSYHITNRYASGFLWLDKLGLSAKMGIGVVMRQSFYGQNYSLIENDFFPNPDYWLSYVHKQLVGTEVLDLQVTPDTLYWPGSQAADDFSENLRVYAHCTKPSGRYQRGALTFFAINMKNDSAETLYFSGILSMQNVDVYMLTPGDADGLLSKYMNLNGVRLAMMSDTELPALVPHTQAARDGVVVAPLTFGFYVFPEANVYVCLNGK